MPGISVTLFKLPADAAQKAVAVQRLDASCTAPGWPHDSAAPRVPPLPAPVPANPTVGESGTLTGPEIAPADAEALRAAIVAAAQAVVAAEVPAQAVC